jgi:hypothetical protein
VEGAPHLAASGYAAHPRHIDIEKHRVAAGVANLFQRSLATRRFGDRKAHLLECIAKCPPNGTLVVNDEDLTV